MNPGIAQAANDGGPEVLFFALTVSGVVIFILGSLVWWFMKERIQLTQRRLNAGNERFEKQEVKQDKTEEDVIAIRATYVHKDECKDIRKERDQQHADTARRLGRIQDHQHEMDRKLSSLCGEMKSGFQTTSGLLAKLVEVQEQGE